MKMYSGAPALISYPQHLRLLANYPRVRGLLRRYGGLRMGQAIAVVAMGSIR